MDFSPQDTGPCLEEEGVRFTLYSQHAEGVEVCLFDSLLAPESGRIALTRHDDGLWSGVAQGAGSGQLYGFRVHGPHAPAAGHRFNPAKLLTDPRALALTGEPPLDDTFAGSRPDNDFEADPRDTATLAPKSIVVDRGFDWQGDRPLATPWQDTVIYECHVRGMSALHPEVPKALRGTYLGLASEPVLDHLENLGITAVELLPVQQIASEPHLLRNGLRNYFGYSPLAFFAPHAGYASGAEGSQVREFKQMVRTLHRRGIEVILDVVLNHTAEGDHRGRTLSLRGIDNRTYYRLRSDDLRLYRDSTGCGNSIAADHPAVTRLLVDCLRYWVEEMHVDGFRFDLAVTLGRAPELFSVEAPLFRAIADDPVLATTKLIAEPWDLGTKGYQRGAFPNDWLEWDDHFRDTCRRLWRGDGGGNRNLMNILRGVTATQTVQPAPSTPRIHFVTCHDGFTLEDLVSFEHKNNWANGEENRDGSNNNFSCNWGLEGASEAPEVRERRARAKRNLLATVLLSRGVPMLLHGDELNRTQNGNNNAYGQDNEVTWIDWNLDADDLEMKSFASNLISIRSRLAPLRLGVEGVDDSNERQWQFLTAQGHLVDPETGTSSALPMGLCSMDASGRGILIVFNVGARDRLVRLPGQPRPGRWTRLLSSVEPGQRGIQRATYRIPARSISVLEHLPSALTGFPSIER